MAEENLTSTSEPDLPQRIDVKQAVWRAREFLLNLYEDEDVPNLRLEEVELSDDGRYWLITLGFTGFEQEASEHPLFQVPFATPPRPRREYKIVAIDAFSGEPESMKIREL